MPLAPAVIVIHDGALLTAVHAHVPPAVTAIAVPAPPAAAIDSLVGAIVLVQLGGGGGGAAAWLTVKVWPAMVIVPVRAAPVFAATVKLTDPGPVPLAPAVIVIHDGALLTAVHAHVPPAVTAIVVPAPPAAAIDSLVGAIVLVQLGGGGGGAAAWLTVKVWPAMVIVPVRAAPVFAATVKLTDPGPVPLAPAVIVIHDGALLTAVHAHVPPAVTAIAVPAPPAARD